MPEVPKGNLLYTFEILSESLPQKVKDTEICHDFLTDYTQTTKTRVHAAILKI